MPLVGIRWYPAWSSQRWRWPEQRSHGAATDSQPCRSCSHLAGCKSCPAYSAVTAGTVRPTTIVDCICKAGYYKYNGQCVNLCPANFYVGPNGVDCKACPETGAGQTTNPSPNNKSFCVCPGTSFWEVVSDVATCTSCAGGAQTITNNNTNLIRSVR